VGCAFRKQARPKLGLTLEAAADVANNPVAEGATAGHPAGAGGLPHATLAKALDEDLRNRVVEIGPQGRAARYARTTPR
jgi:hypothetical protein